MNDRKNLSVGINLACGVIGIGIGFGLAPLYYFWGNHNLNGYYIAGISLVPVVGSIIEWKYVRAGSIICLISGITLMVMSIFPIFFASIPFFVMTAGSVLGLAIKEMDEETGEVIKKREETNEISVGLSLLGGFFGIMLAIVNGILSGFTLFTILMIVVGIVPFIGAFIKYYRNLFIGSAVCLISGILLLILILVGVLTQGYLAYFAAVLRNNVGDLARLVVFFVAIIPYLLVIADGARGIFVARKVKES
ncbi:MAG: hypothetical protein ACXAEX_20795 [Promethearchaeota archaeon]